MNIQSFIDRKRIAGAREHEGNSSDWAGWHTTRYEAAIAGEVLDALAYAQKVLGLVSGEEAETTISIIKKLIEVIDILSRASLEEACQEAEQEAENG